MDAQTIIQSIVVAALVTVIGQIINGLIARRIRTPGDENETVKLGNEFMRGLLTDAKEEREELRQSIKELKAEKTTSLATIERLEELDRRKTDRIEQLESGLEHLAHKVSDGVTVHLDDIIRILGRDLGMKPIDGFEDTITHI